jgi:hypothetical protein
MALRHSLSGTWKLPPAVMPFENRALAGVRSRADAVDPGEIGAGHSATAFYAVRLSPGARVAWPSSGYAWKTLPPTHQFAYRVTRASQLHGC